jgi:hypothetical protein
MAFSPSRLSGISCAGEPGLRVGQVSALDVVADQVERPLVVRQRGLIVAKPSVYVGSDGP